MRRKRKNDFSRLVYYMQMVTTIFYYSAYVPSSRSEAISMGINRYFTGKPCKHGHISLRAISNSGCTKCISLMFKEKYKRERDVILERMRVKYIDDPEKFKNRAKEWEYKNPWSGKVRQSRHRAKNREVLNKKWREYYKVNKKKREKYMKEYRSKNAHIIYKNSKDRRARERGAEGSYDLSDVINMLQEQGYKCNEVKCKADLNISGYHVDHIIPLIKGGRNDKINLQCLCPRCNLMKGALMPDEWEERKRGIEW